MVCIFCQMQDSCLCCFLYSSVHKYFDTNIFIAFHKKLNISMKKEYREVFDMHFKMQKENFKSALDFFSMIFYS